MRYLNLWKKLTLLFVFFAAQHSRCAEASGTGGFFVFFPERQQERKSSRWTLSDWLNTKKTINDQNTWLSRHSNKVPVDLTYIFEAHAASQMSHELEFFLMWLGLHARYEGPWASLDPLFGPLPNDPMQKAGDAGFAIRLVGGNPQNTSLTVRALLEYTHIYGLSSAVVGPYKGWVFEPEMQIYLAPWLGVRGSYRKRLEQINSSQSNVHLTGDSWWAGPFLEANSLRVEIVYESRKWLLRDASSLQDIHSFSSGMIASRLRLFF